MNIHIGGTEPRDGWQIIDATDRPEVDVVGNCVDLSHWSDGSVDRIYASHVFEHLGYQHELPTALAECHRVLKETGILQVSVPDLDQLAKLLLSPILEPDHRFHVMRVLMGGQTDEHDFHRVAFTDEILGHFLVSAGFRAVERVSEFRLFDDCSTLTMFGVPISLNMVCRK